MVKKRTSRGRRSEVEETRLHLSNKRSGHIVDKVILFDGILNRHFLLLVNK